MRLIEALKIQAQCEKEDELKNLSEEKKKRLAKLVEERVPSGLAPIEEWNELLSIFMDAPWEKDNEIAKKKLLSYLRNEVYEEEISATTEKNKWWQSNDKR